MTVHASVVVTAEHTCPVYPTEAAALYHTGDKRGSGNSCHWAVWLRQGDNVELVAQGFKELGLANEYAKELAQDIVNAGGMDELKALRLKQVRVN